MSRPRNSRRNEPLVTLTDDELIEELVNVLDRDEKTLHKYRRFLDEYAAWLATQNQSLLTANHADVVRYVAYLRSEKRVWKDSAGREVTKPVSASSRKGVIAALRRFYKHGLSMEYFFGIDPMLEIETPRVTVKRGLTVGKTEIRKLLDAPGSERCRVQCYLQVFTLARSASITGLSWSDIDFEQNIIHFDAKFDTTYSLPIHSELRGALLRWRSAQREEAETNEAIAEALRSDSTAYVLLTRQGLPLAHTTLAKQLKWRADRAGVLHVTLEKRSDARGENKSRISPHAIRRSVATMMRKEVSRSRTSPRSSTTPT